MGIRLKGQTSGYVEIKAPATAADNTLTFPNGNGSNNQVLTTDGNGGLTFAAPQLSTDTTPQLGGDLDVNGNDIVTTSNGDIDLDPNGSGQVVFKGNSTRGSGQIKLNCEQNSHGITVKGPPHSSGANYTLTLPNDTGTSGQLLSTNGSGVTSWASVGGGATFEATASGAIANGDACIVKSDGNVAAVARTTTLKGTPTIGTELEIANGNIQATHYTTQIVFNPFQRVHGLIFTDSTETNKPRQSVYDPNRNSRSNSANFVSDTNAIKYPSSCFDLENQRGFLFYGKYSNARPQAVAFEVNGGKDDNGGTVVAGDEFDVATTEINSDNSGACYHRALGKVVMVYGDNNDEGVAHVGQISPENNSVRTSLKQAFYTAASVNSVAIVYDEVNEKVVIAYCPTNTTQLEVVVGTVTANNGISFGSAASVTTVNPQRLHGTYDPVTGKCIFVFNDVDDTNYGKAVVATVSGTSVSLGTVVTFDSDATNGARISYDQCANRHVVLYKDNNGYLEYKVGTASGTTISFGSGVNFSIAVQGANSHNIMYDPIQQKHVIAYVKSANDDLFVNTGLVTDSSSTNLTEENYIGIADAAYSDTSTATIQVASSVDDAQSGLTPGKKQFVHTDGEIRPFPDILAEVVAGTAVAATKLIVKG